MSDNNCTECGSSNFEWLGPTSDWTQEEIQDGDILICVDCGADTI
jgi:hypothetical protein